ncbi:hypothetical protein [Nitrosovibrio sp. Nv17]|uniref:hypothetical protein n=1 Tax=Nitrosovibrio sp. Nv17 TaxID=1855339 RepID=UPI0009090AF6|nr:hypothetical protein [Nitrosovibrio sp. Nv17]SFW36987.1 hypothetical protein SAMN05216414_12511 [Nitrosovibrio sp. Nv17]
MTPILKALAIGAICIGWIAGCSSTHKTTQSARTPIEQLLISEAVTRSLPAPATGHLPIPQGAKVAVDTSGLTPDQSLIQHVLAGWLGQQGYAVQKDEANAAYRVNAVVGALGTELAGTLFGLPPIQSQFIPISLPELALYKSQYQTGYARFHLNVFEIPSGRFVGSTPVFLADAYYNDYTFLFVISHTATDVAVPPRFGTLFRKPLDTPYVPAAEEAKGTAGSAAATK